MKKLLGFVLGSALAFLGASPAFAASISNPLFSNGQTTIDATGGTTVSGTFTLTVGTGEVVEWLRTQSDPSQPFVDASIGGQLGDQEQVYTNVPFSVKVPPNTGTYYPTVQGAGIFGGNRAINGGDNVVLGSTGLGTVRVVTNGSSSETSGSSVSQWDAVMAALQAIVAKLSAPTPAPTPVGSTACTAYAQASAGAMAGMRSDANGRLQGFLIGQGFSIPLLMANLAPFGFWGNQTAQAVAAFQSSNHCY